MTVLLIENDESRRDKILTRLESLNQNVLITFCSFEQMQQQIKENAPDFIVIDTPIEHEGTALALIREVNNLGISILFLNSNKALDKPHLKQTSIEVRGKQQQKKQIPFEDILWIDVERNYCFLKTEQNKYGLKMSLSHLITLLDKRFMQIHRSCIVNVDYVSSVQISKQQLRVKGHILTIGRLYKKQLLQYLAERD